MYHVLPVRQGRLSFDPDNTLCNVCHHFSHFTGGETEARHDVPGVKPGSVQAIWLRSPHCQPEASLLPWRR